LKQLESIRRIVASRSAAIERLAVGVVDILLAYGAFEDYWLDLPFDQTELEGRDFLKARRVPESALTEIAAAVEAHVTECLRGARGRGAA
jgi:hypothetical protein